MYDILVKLPLKLTLLQSLSFKATFRRIFYNKVDQVFFFPSTQAERIQESNFTYCSVPKNVPFYVFVLKI